MDNIICACLRPLILFVSFDINFKSIFLYIFFHSHCYSYCSTGLENCPSSSCFIFTLRYRKMVIEISFFNGRNFDFFDLYLVLSKYSFDIHLIWSKLSSFDLYLVLSKYGFRSSKRPPDLSAL